MEDGAMKAGSRDTSSNKLGKKEYMTEQTAEEIRIDRSALC